MKSPSEENRIFREAIDAAEWFATTETAKGELRSLGRSPCDQAEVAEELEELPEYFSSKELEPEPQEDLFGWEH